MPDMLSLIIILCVVAALLSLLVFQFITGVPPMSASAAESANIVSLLKQAGVGEQAIIYELGCGWGALAIALATAFPHAQVRGIELSPLPYGVARFRTRHMPNVTLYRGNFYHYDLRGAEAVTCYLMTKPMPKLALYLDRMLTPGTPVVSLTFWFRGREVSAVPKGPGMRSEAALYYWPANSNAAGRGGPAALSL